MGKKDKRSVIFQAKHLVTTHTSRLMTPQTFSSQYISVASPSLSLSLYELQLFESLSTRLPLPSLFFSTSGFVCSGMDGGVGLCWTDGHTGQLPAAIGGKSVRDDFGGGNASANMQDSLYEYDPGADRDCLSQAQVWLYFSSS